MSTPTVSPEYVWRWQCDPTFDADSNLNGTPLVTFYQKDLDLGGGSPKQFIPSSPSSMTVDLFQNASKTVVFNGATYSYGELIGALVAVQAQERALQLNPPAPEPEVAPDPGQ